MESLRHKKLKEAGKHILKKLKFKDSEIFEEFGLGKNKYDVVGWNDNWRIAVECGRVRGTSHKCIEYFIESLKFFDSIIWIPYDIFESAYFDFSIYFYDELKLAPFNISTPKKLSQYANYLNKDGSSSFVGLHIFSAERFLSEDPRKKIREEMSL